MSAKVINMAGEDITPLPPSLEEEMVIDIIENLQKGIQMEELTQLLKEKYKIERI